MVSIRRSISHCLSGERFMGVIRQARSGLSWWASNRALATGTSAIPADQGSERHDLAYGGDVGQAVEAGIDLLEPEGAALEPIDRQPPLPVKLDEARHVALRDARAHVAAADRLFVADETGVIEGVGRRRRGQAGGDDRTAAVEDLGAERKRLDRAGHLEGEIDPAAGGIANLLGTIRIA